MAIAGWLVIGVALLILVAVINNSWRPLLDQFRGLVGSGGTSPPAGAPPADQPQYAPPAAEPPAAEPPSTAPTPPNNQGPIVEPAQPPAVAA